MLGPQAERDGFPNDEHSAQNCQCAQAFVQDNHSEDCADHCSRFKKIAARDAGVWANPQFQNRNAPAVANNPWATAAPQTPEEKWKRTGREISTHTSNIIVPRMIVAAVTGRAP